MPFDTVLFPVATLPSAEATLSFPTKVPALVALAVFDRPPPANAFGSVALLRSPPPANELLPADSRSSPPPVNEQMPDALPSLPATEAELFWVALLRSPTAKLFVSVARVLNPMDTELLPDASVRVPEAMLFDPQATFVGRISPNMAEPATSRVCARMSSIPSSRSWSWGLNSSLPV